MAGRIKSMKNPNDPTGNRTRELPAFRVVSRPSLELTVVLHCMPFLHVSRKYYAY